MRMATWNVNSIRTRLTQVIEWIQQESIDLLCLQETKVIDADFPTAEFRDLGYQVYVSGQKAYNGVALISREPLTEVSKGFTPVLGTEQVGDFDDQKRVITGIIQGVRMINLYVPNGSDVGSDKYVYKLRWLEILKAYLHYWIQTDRPQLLVCGDFNIALEDRDIYDPKKAGQIMASDPERQALQAILDLGFEDIFRTFRPDPGYFSWWDYRSGGFQRNRGWRIDHIYLTRALVAQATDCHIDPGPRGNPKPSDHAPVVLDLI